MTESGNWCELKMVGNNHDKNVSLKISDCGISGSHSFTTEITGIQIRISKDGVYFNRGRTTRFDVSVSMLRNNDSDSTKQLIYSEFIQKSIHVTWLNSDGVTDFSDGWGPFVRWVQFLSHAVKHQESIILRMNGMDISFFQL